MATSHASRATRLLTSAYFSAAFFLGQVGVEVRHVQHEHDLARP